MRYLHPEPDEVNLTFHLGNDLVEMTARVLESYDGPNTPNEKTVEIIEVQYFDGLKEDYINPPKDINWELMFWSQY